MKRSSSPLKDFNLNSIIVLVATAGIGWLVTNGLGSLKDTKQTAVETKNSVSKIETALPYIKDQVNDVKNQVASVQTDVKDIRSNFVTRTELSNKHAALQDSIKEVKSNQQDFRTQLDQIKKK